MITQQTIRFVMSSIVVLFLLIALATFFPGYLQPCFKNQDCSYQDQIVFWQLRLPRVLLAFMVGATLAVGGVVFQALFRNPLASPYTLGVSSGAALGAALYISLTGSVLVVGSITLSFAALLGACSTAIAIVILIARAGLDSNSSILLGVVINLFFSSLILLIQYMSDQMQLLQLTRWLMGSISVVGWHELSLLSAFLAVILPLIYGLAARLDLLSFGDEAALAQGVPVRSSYIIFISLVSIMIAVVVSVTGPIGFIGIVVPHYLRRMGFRQNRQLLSSSVLFGGLFLAVCDTIARSIVFPFEVPVGVVTALLGSPLFFWILLKKRVVK